MILLYSTLLAHDRHKGRSRGMARPMQAAPVHGISAMAAALSYRHHVKRVIVPLLLLAGRQHPGHGAGMAGQNRAHSGAVRPGIDARHRGAADRRWPGEEISRQHFPGRKQAGRQRQSRHRRGRQSRARRRHHRHQHRRAARHQHAAVFEIALRSAQRYRADHAARHAAERARRQPGAQGQHRRRTGGAAESQPGQIQFQFDRQRLAVASGHGGDRAQGRRATGAPALSRLAAGHHRRHPQRRADGLPAGDFGDAAGGGRER